MQSRGSTKSTDKARTAVSIDLDVIYSLLLSSTNTDIASIKLHCPMVSTGAQAAVTAENTFNFNLNTSSYPND